MIDELNINFENVSIGEIHEIENFLQCIIHVFGCNENLNNNKIIRKSLKNYDKHLDLLLVDNINYYIIIKDIKKFISNNSHVVKSCRNCLNSFYSLDKYKYKFHIEYCNNRKLKKLLPSFKKCTQFENLKNYILHNWIIHSDFEFIIDPNTKEHRFISGDYLLECKNEKYSKNIQTFYDLQGYTKSLYNELKYVENIDENDLQNPIDYSNFEQNKFDNIHVFGCNENLNNKKIIRKSLKNYDKDLDSLTIDGINHYITS